MDSNRKLNVAAQALRMRIVEGKLPPGTRLPTQRDLSGEFNLSSVTLQKAANQLAREGFLIPMGSRGTFVADHPPHLCRYAIAFPSRLDGIHFWTDYWTLLLRAAEGIGRADGRAQFAPFFEIGGNSGAEDYRRLMADVRARRVAGIILLSNPSVIWNTSLLHDCPVPRVYIGGDAWKFKIPSVSVDVPAFFRRGLEFAARRLRRRPMMIGTTSYEPLMWEPWSSACQQNGMTPARCQMLSVPLPPDPGARHIAQILMKLPPDSRPDVLVVTDDHLVENVTAGLLASALPESELPLVIVQTNFPKLPHAMIPVTYLGFDSTQIIRACLELLDVQRRGEEPQPAIRVPAVFDFERPVLLEGGFAPLVEHAATDG